MLTDSYNKRKQSKQTCKKSLFRSMIRRPLTSSLSSLRLRHVVSHRTVWKTNGQSGPVVHPPRDPKRRLQNPQMSSQDPLAGLGKCVSLRSEMQFDSSQVFENIDKTIDLSEYTSGLVNDWLKAIFGFKTDLSGLVQLIFIYFQLKSCCRWTD